MPVIRSSTMPPRVWSVAAYFSYVRPASSKVIVRSRSESPRARPRLPAGGSASSVTSALPSPETPSLSLTITWPIAGFCARRRTIASTTSSTPVRFSTPRGCGTPTSAKIRRAPLFVPNGRKRGSAPYIGMPEGQGQIAFEVRRVERHEVRAFGIDDERPDAIEDVRAVKELLTERPRRSVERRDEKQAPARVARGHAGQQVEVVLDDLGRDRLRRHVDHPRSRLAQAGTARTESALRRPAGPRPSP